MITLVQHIVRESSLYYMHLKNLNTLKLSLQQHIEEQSCSKTAVISQQPKNFPVRLSKAKFSQADTPPDKLSYATRNGMH